MFFLILKIFVAVAAGLTIYLMAAFVIRSFSHVPPAEPDVRILRAVRYRYRCTVCGTEVTMTSTPEGAVPDAPRHCREDMSLVVEGGDW